MRRFACGIYLATLVIANQVVAPSASALVPVDYCQYYPCQEGDSYVVFPLPPTVTAYPCDADGHAPPSAADETSDLQAWIDLVPDGMVRNVVGSHITEWHVLLFPGGLCIRMDGHLSIRERNYLLFEGGGVTSAALTVDGVTLDQHLKPATGAPYPGGGTWNGSGGWGVWRGSHLQWRSFKIVGAHSEKTDSLGLPTKVSTYGMCHAVVNGHTSCEWQNGWAIMGAQHVMLEGNETRNTHGDSVEILWGANGDYWAGDVIDARYITINNHKVYGAGRQGISAISGQDITISNSYIEGAASNAIDLEPESSDNRFPIRRVTITNNIFGQSFATIGVVAYGVCADVTDVYYTHNEQIEPNITVWPPVVGVRPSGCSVNPQRGPFTITDNKFWVERWWYDPDVAASFTDFPNVTYSRNEVKHTCYPGTGCSAHRTAVELRGGSGHVVNDNNLALPGGQAWSSVYEYDGVVHGSLGVNVSSCGNTTAQGTNQPNAC